MFSQLGQDEWVLSRIKTPGYFVDIGASDGVTNSNSYLLEQRGWLGVCVEPNLESFQLLAKNRKCQLSAMAIHTVSNHALDLIIAGEYSSLWQYAEFDGHGEQRKGKPTQRVMTQTLDDLLATKQAPKRIDYLSLDVEGAELDILASFSWEYDVQLITVEHNNNANKQALANLLVSKGYTQAPEPSQWDFWFEKGH